jgi:hypothetical protein
MIVESKINIWLYGNTKGKLTTKIIILYLKTLDTNHATEHDKFCFLYTIAWEIWLFARIIIC